MAKEYIEREAVISAVRRAWARDLEPTQYIEKIPTADVVEVVRGYHEGDVCIYGFGSENNSRAIVEIVKILNDERGVAEVKFHKVFVDDTGNGFFNYLLKSGGTMNASFQYLKNITPRMDGDNDGNKENL